MCVDNTVYDVQSFHHHHHPPHEAPAFQRLETLTEAWLAELQYIFSMLLNLCTLLGLWTWSLRCWSSTLYVCKATHGSKRWTEHEISTLLCPLQKVWVFTMSCASGQSFQALIVKIFMPETRTCHKYKHVYIYGHFTDNESVDFLMSFNSLNAMMFGVLVL